MTVSVPVQGQKTDIPVLTGRWEAKGLVLPLLFCSVQAFIGLDDANPRWGGPPTESTDSLPISGHTTADTPRNNI